MSDQFTYQWKRNSTVIAVATSGTYTLQSADVGQEITCTVTATNTDGSVSVTTVPTGAVGSSSGGLPDMIVTAIGGTLGIIAGQTPAFTATAANQGTGATPAGIVTGVAFLVDGTEVTYADQYTTSVPAGGSITLSADTTPTWVATAGSHTLQAWVNDTGRYSEADTTNNTMSVSFSVAAAAGGGSGAVTDIAPGTKGISCGFGLADIVANYSGSQLTSMFDQMAGAGVKWLRWDYGWQGGTTGSSRNGAADAVFQAAATAGINCIALLDDMTNSGAAATNGFAGAWMSSAVQHLNSLGVHVFEIQNEMNYGSNWSSGTPSVSAYVATLKAAYQTIHAADSQAVVLHCGLAPYGSPTGSIQGSNWNPYDWFKEMYANGAQGYFDASNWHLYCYPDMPETSDSSNTFNNLPTWAYETMRANGDGAKKVWCTEWGTDTASEQAQTCTEGYSMAQSWSWAGPFLWFTWVDDTDGTFGLFSSYTPGSTGGANAGFATFAGIANPAE
jgi:hypothetical protein